MYPNTVTFYKKENIIYYIYHFVTYIKLGGINLNQNDMQTLMNILSKMDKKDLEQGLNKASQILSSKDKEMIINKLKGNH